MCGTVFHKSWQYSAWGKKIDFQNLQRKYAYDISNALYFITDQKSHTKTKIWGHLGPHKSKIWSQNNLGLLKAYFWSTRTQMTSHFRFYVRFLTRDKIQSVWYIIRRVFCADFENRILFKPISQYRQFLWNKVPRINERSEEKKRCRFRL